ncbi:uncharacterized protein M421DRAFT_373863 [Didymella exigua CBS 183.55]|uniref:Uncharacterized protein n=1 Tax=Didymella exigua CBS 183.55 TaxID=1150837 RepID=A0A6A5RQ05_9PLEO|nr:uncharacterized protein M421DRAFT_373863 [Didymella exigua CBS 183.55]KAF1930415.1 hypothetical protein M421DRAFT_373863 [Didymella exigua CBS 183.55]
MSAALIVLVSYDVDITLHHGVRDANADFEVSPFVCLPRCSSGSESEARCKAVSWALRSCPATPSSCCFLISWSAYASRASFFVSVSLRAPQCQRPPWPKSDLWNLCLFCARRTFQVFLTLERCSGDCWQLASTVVLQPCAFRMGRPCRLNYDCE